MSRTGSTAVLSPLVALVSGHTDLTIYLCKGIMTRVFPSSSLDCKFNTHIFNPWGLGGKLALNWKQKKGGKNRYPVVV